MIKILREIGGVMWCLSYSNGAKFRHLFQKYRWGSQNVRETSPSKSS